MKHRIGFNALSRNSSERKALKRNMVTSLFRYERIETTKAKALEVRRMAEKMITRAKEDTVHNRRIIARDIYDEAIVAKLFKEIAPMFAERKGFQFPQYPYFKGFHPCALSSNSLPSRVMRAHPSESLVM